MHICIVVRVIWLIVMWNVTQLLQTVSLSLQFLPLMIKMSTTDEKKRKVFSILAVISLVGTISGTSLKLLPPDGIF